MGRSLNTPPTRQPTRNRRFLWVLLAPVALAVWIVAQPACWLAPVEIIAEIDGLPDGAKVIARTNAFDYTEVPLRAAPLPASRNLTVIATGEHNPASPASEVYFCPPTNGYGEGTDADNIECGAGWTKWKLDDRWFANPTADRPATLHWSGTSVGPLRLPVLKHPRGGIVRVELEDGESTTVDLYAPAEEWTEIVLRPKQTIASWIGRLPLSIDGLELRTEGGSATCTRVRAVWGEKTLLDHTGPHRVDGSYRNVGDLKITPARIYGWAAANASLVLAKAILYAIVCVLLGLPIAVLAFPRLNGLERWAAAMMAGASTPVVISVTLTRLLFTGIQAFWIACLGFAGLTILLVLFDLATGCRRLRLLVPTKHECVTAFLLFVAGATSALLMFYPILSYPTWYLGHALTDACFYINHAEAFRHHSINLLAEPDWRISTWIAHLVAPIYGWTERTGDLFSLLNSALLYRTDTRTVFAQHHLNFWLTLPLVAYCIFNRVLVTRTATWLGVTLFATSGVLLSLFTQNYSAQYVSAIYLVYSLTCAVFYISNMNEAATSRVQHTGHILLLAVTMAATLGVFPAQFLLPPALAIALLWMTAELRKWKPIGLLAVIGITTAAASNLALIPVLAAPTDVPQYMPRLNAIGKSVVFPFYNDPARFGAVAFGLRDWVNTSKEANAITEDLIGADVGIRNWLPQHSPPICGALLMGCALLSALGVGAGIFHNRAARVLVITTLVYASVATALYVSGNIYLGAKTVMTLGVLFLFCVTVGVDTLLRRNAMWIRPPVVAFAVLLAAVNVSSAWFENCTWLLTRRHPIQERRHVALINADLREFVDAAKPLADEFPTRPIAIVGDYARGRGADSDLIVVRYIQHVFAQREILFDPDGDEWRLRQPRLAVVFAGFSLPEYIQSAASLVASNRTLSLYTLNDIPTPRTVSVEILGSPRQVDIEYTVTDKRTSRRAISRGSADPQALPPFAPAVDLTPILPANPTSAAAEIYARPFRDNTLAIDNFMLGDGWSIWEGERLLFSNFDGRLGQAGIPWRKEPDAVGISRIDFARSPRAGRVRVAVADTPLDELDLYSPNDSWSSVDLPNEQRRYTAWLPAGASDIRWRLVSAPGDAPATIIAAFDSQRPEALGEPAHALKPETAETTPDMIRTELRYWPGDATLVPLSLEFADEHFAGATLDFDWRGEHYTVPAPRLLGTTVEIVPLLLDDPASNRTRIDARPFADQRLAIDSFDVPTGWWLWNDERLCVAAKGPQPPAPAVSAARGGRGISRVDFLKSNVGGRVLLRVDGRDFAPLDLYSDEESWVKIPVPPGTPHVRAWAPADATNVRWAIEPEAEMPLPTIRAATCGQRRINVDELSTLFETANLFVASPGQVVELRLIAPLTPPSDR